MTQTNSARRIVFMALAAWFASTGWSLGDDWPQWRGPTRDGVWREDGLVDKFADNQLKVRWRQPIAQRLQRADRGRGSRVRHRSRGRTEASRTRPLLRRQERRTAMEP